MIIINSNECMIVNTIYNAIISTKLKDLLYFEAIFLTQLLMEFHIFQRSCELL